MISRITYPFVPLLFFTWLLAGAVEACTICVPYPTRTVADFLIESPVVVLARENPDKPFSYRIIEPLKGEPSGFDVDLFIDSGTRRMLTAHPEHGVVLVRASGGEWRSLGFADAEVEAVMRRILHRAPAWASNATASSGRLAFFARLLGHDNRRLHELAYLGVGRAPYSEIGRISGMWPAVQIRVLLANPRYLEWRPLAIMMLAHNGNEQDHRFLVRAYSTSESLGISNNLAAYATALIEIERADGVAMIEDHYFRRPGREQGELEAVIEALSVHGSGGHTFLRPRIVEAYGVLLDNYGSVGAGAVAAAMTRWRRWDLADALAVILAEEAVDPKTAYAVELHLSRAGSAALGLE